MRLSPRRKHYHGLLLYFVSNIPHLRYQFFRMTGFCNDRTINIWYQVKVVKCIFYVRVPHIAHKIRKHGIYILSLPKPAVHIRINKMMPKIIRADADTGILFFLEKQSTRNAESSFLTWTRHMGHHTGLEKTSYGSGNNCPIRRS